MPGGIIGDPIGRGGICGGPGGLAPCANVAATLGGPLNLPLFFGVFCLAMSGHPVWLGKRSLRRFCAEANIEPGRLAVWSGGGVSAG
jgi:hypothetical protein